VIFQSTVALGVHAKIAASWHAHKYYLTQNVSTGSPGLCEGPQNCSVAPPQISTTEVRTDAIFKVTANLILNISKFYI